MRSPLAVRVLVAVGLAVTTALTPLPGRPPDARAQPTTPFPIPDEAALPAAVTLPVDDEPPAPEELPTLVEVRDRAAAHAGLMPQAEWDVDALALALEYDPERAFLFVRDRIAFDPYAGVLRGPEGTLAARAGNAWDRALLLAALLEAMGVAHRFALADLDDRTVDRVLERASIPPIDPLPAPGLEATGLDADAIRARATRDYARLDEALGDRIESITGQDDGAHRDALRRHAWVQAAHGTGWRDLDPTLPEAEAGIPLVPASQAVASLPDDAWHALTIRVTAGTVGDAGLTESVVLERGLSAAQAAAADVFVTFVPYDPNLGTVVATALSGEVYWAPAIIIETEIATGTPFRVGGRGTDAFGDAIERVELATLRLSVERRAPDGTTTEAQRILLDRVPDGFSEEVAIEDLAPLPGDEAGPYVLSQFHHLIVSTGGTDRREYAIERSVSAEYVGTSLDSDLPVEAYDLPGILWPVAVADQALVVASEAAAVPSLEADGRFRAFVAEPRVTLMSVGRDAQDGSVAFATDLLIDGVGLLPTSDVAPGEAARRRMWYGVLQTALETEIAIRRASLLDPTARTISGVSLEAGMPLRVLVPDDAGDLAEGAPAALRDALVGGANVLVPGDPVEAKAWWTVDGRTGATRSILDPGLGGAVPRGSVGPAVRVLDTSYTHGKGARLPPRPPMQRPPPGGFGGGGGGGAAPRGLTSPRTAPAPCGPSDSTGYIATVTCVSVVHVASWILLGIGLASLATVWYLILTT